MKHSGWVCLWMVAAVPVAGCQSEVVISEEEDRALLEASADQKCVLDIRVDEKGRTIWKGEAISDEEFDRRLRDGQISEACVEKTR